MAVTDSDPSVHPAYQSGDANSNGKLDLGETWVYTATGTAIAGQYANTGTASGTDATGTVTTSVSRQRRGLLFRHCGYDDHQRHEIPRPDRQRH